MLKKKTQVVMLPTSKAIKINDYYLSIVNEDDTKTLRYGKKVQEPFNCSVINYHLYFLSLEEKPQIGDWYIVELFDVEHNGTLHLEQVKSIDDVWVNNTDIVSTRHINNCKKVIASTDKNLEPNKSWTNFEKISDIYLPYPSQLFINKFIEKWNNKTPIQFVNVEYEKRHVGWTEDQSEYIYEDFIKVDKNNEITITPIKDSWNKEEIKHLLECAWNGGAFWGSSKPNSHYFDKWIEENL